MNQNTVKNIRNTMTEKEIHDAMAENRKRRGNAYCSTCDRWWYGVSTKRCETHNPVRHTATEKELLEIMSPYIIEDF